MTAEPAPRPLHLVESVEVIRLKAVIESMQAEHEKMAADMRNMERDLKAKRSRITWLENELAGRYRSDVLYPTACELFDFWRKRCRPKAKTFGDDRLKAVLARLRDTDPDDPDKPAYPPRYIAEAIVGAQIDAFVDERGTRHNDIELVCRSGKKLEAFHAKYERYVARREASRG